MNQKLLIQWFTEKLELAGYSKRTVRSYEYDLSLFCRYLNDIENVKNIEDAGPEHITAYQTHLHYGLFKGGQHLHIHTIHIRLSCIKKFFKLRYDEGYSPADLGVHVVLPRQKRSIPRNVPSAKEVCAFLDSIEPRSFDPITLRDRCMLELMYATGLRAMETLRLSTNDFDLNEMTLFVHGKGAKDRIAPIGAWVKPWLLEYLETGRPKLIDERRPCDLLFVSKRGQPLAAPNLGAVIQKYQSAMPDAPRIWAHGLRHACATHMLEGGADIRYIQELLGHSDLGSTQIYTRVDITQLKKVHHQCHPRERE